MPAEGSGADEPLRAAGAVVWRRRADGGVDVLLIHRPKYDDWSLPKGKVEPGETDAECAVREVEEETGLACALGAELSISRYRVSDGRTKQVRYWAMEACGEPRACAEVDACRWVPAADASVALTYERDWAVVADLIEHVGTDRRPAP